MALGFINTEDAKDETVVFVADSGKVFVRSGAILRATASVAPMWLYVLCLIALLIPDIVRDTVYKQVARNRIRIFGAKETCRRATKEDKQHFLE